MTIKLLATIFREQTGPDLTVKRKKLNLVPKDQLKIVSP